MISAAIPVRVKYFNQPYKLKKNPKGDWYDLYTKEDITILGGQYSEIPLGIAVELPAEFEAIVAPRSSTFRKYGLLQTNGIGVIDNSYNGDNDEWTMPVLNARKNPVTIPEGTRLCQFRIIHNQPPLVFREVETLGNTDRGGLGSTGD